MTFKQIKKTMKKKDYAEAKLTGCLKKLGGTLISTFQDRFVILKDCYLIWFKSRKDKTPQNSLFLGEAGVEIELKNGQLKIVPGGNRKDYIFKAENAEALEKWHQAIVDARNTYLSGTGAKGDGKRGSGSAAAEPDAAPADDNLSDGERLRQFFIKGDVFTKFNKVGLGKKRDVWFTDNLNRIMWGIKKKKDTTIKGFIMTQNIVGVEDGKQPNRFTIVAKDRTLELEASDFWTKRRWSSALDRLLKETRS